MIHLNIDAESFTFIREGWRCDRFRYPLYPERGDKDTRHTGKMAVACSSKGHKSSRLLRPVADSDYDSLSEIASELTNLPRNSFVNGYKFFADSLLRGLKVNWLCWDWWRGNPLVVVPAGNQKVWSKVVIFCKGDDDEDNWFVTYTACILW